MQWRDADIDTDLGGDAARRRHLQLVMLLPKPSKTPLK